MVIKRPFDSDAGHVTLFDYADLPGKADPETGRGNPGETDEAGKHLPEMGRRDPAATAGQRTPRNGQHVPRQLPYAFDWSITRGVTAISPEGYTWHCRTTLELIRDVPQGATVVGESTFDSFDLDARQRVLELAETRNVVLLTVPARGNTRRRTAAGFREKTSQSRKTDEEDARAIQLAAVSGTHLKKPAPVDPVWAELREQARQRFIKLRWSGQKDDYARDRMRQLPPFMMQPLDRRIALGKLEDQKLTGWNPVIVAAVGVMAEFVSSRPNFERLAGLYAHGFPSQFRSDLLYWGWVKQNVKQERITITVYRRELRWLFAQFSQAG